MEIITSAKNDQIKRLTSLKRRKYRYRYREFLLEGVLLLQEALEAQLELAMVFISSSFLEERLGEKLLTSLADLDLPIYRVEESLFKSLSDTVSPQGVLAIGKMPEVSLKESFTRRVLVLDRVQDPGNVGTMIRTALAAGCDGLILLKGTVDPYSPKVVRGAMGALFQTPLYSVETPEEALSFLKERGFSLVVAHSRGEPFYSLTYSERVALVVGNEAKGVDRLFLNEAQALAAIPLEEGVDSLNVSLAAGIILYEIYRQKQ